MLKNWINAIMPRWWRSSNIDEHHPHYRRNSPAYLKRRLFVQLGWIILLFSLIIVQASVAIVLFLVALAIALSFVFLDEHT